jgi:hypothetical protein
VGVIGEKGPGVYGEATNFHCGGKPGKEVGPIEVIMEDNLSVDSSHHHMVENAGRIKSRTARHDGT